MIRRVTKWVSPMWLFQTFYDKLPSPFKINVESFVILIEYFYDFSSNSSGLSLMTFARTPNVRLSPESYRTYAEYFKVLTKLWVYRPYMSIQVHWCFQDCPPMWLVIDCTWTVPFTSLSHCFYSEAILCSWKWRTLRPPINISLNLLPFDGC